MNYEIGSIVKANGSSVRFQTGKGKVVGIHNCCAATCADILSYEENKIIKMVSPNYFEVLNEKTKVDVDSISKTVEKATFRPRITHRTIYNKKATIVILSDGTKGVAKCAPDDTYNEEKGHSIALKRAMIKKLNKELKELTK